MTLLDIAKAVREAWDALFVSRHTLFLEAENSRLRAQILHHESRMAQVNLPIMATSAKKEDWAKIPQRVGGESFWTAEVRAAKRAEIFAEELQEPVAQETANV
jgi:hypothetical protein